MADQYSQLHPMSQLVSTIMLTIRVVHTKRNMSYLLSAYIGVYLFHGGIVYANNSAIHIDEIGNYDTYGAIQCITEKEYCCRSNRLGDWFYPDGTIVKPQYLARDYGDGFYRNRGDERSVILNRFNSSVMSPTGFFCCVVPNSEGINQTLCVYICK